MVYEGASPLNPFEGSPAKGARSEAFRDAFLGRGKDEAFTMLFPERARGEAFTMLFGKGQGAKPLKNTFFGGVDLGTFLDKTQVSL